MASTALVSSYVRGFLQQVEEEYRLFKKTHPTGNYQKFYDYLYTPNAEKVRQGLNLALADLIVKIQKVEKNVIEVSKQRKRLLKSVLSIFTVVLVLIAIVVFGLSFMTVKTYKSDVLTMLNRLLMLQILLVVIIALYGFLVMNVKKREKEADRENADDRHSINVFRNLLCKDGRDRKKTEAMLVFLKGITGASPKRIEDLKKKLIKQIALTPEELKLINDFPNLAVNYASKDMIISVHNNGRWNETMTIIEGTSKFKMFQQVNTLLSPLYDLVLKSRKAPSATDEKGVEGINAILDTFVLPELNRLDLLSLSDSQRLSDDTLKTKLEDGMHYRMLIASMYYLALYMYPVYKNVSYTKLVQATDDTTSVLTTAEKNRVLEMIQKEPVLRDIIPVYPIKRSNFNSELTLVQHLTESGTSTSIENIKVVNDFVTLASSKFEQVYKDKNNKFVIQLNNASTISDTKNVLIQYVKEFMPLFTTLYQNVLLQELAHLNPKSSQYFVFQPEYIRRAISTTFNICPVLQKVEEEYRDLIIDIFLSQVIAEQKNNFIKQFYNFDKDTGDQKTLKMIAFDKKVTETVNTIATSMMSFNIRLSDYSQYIFETLALGDNLSTELTGTMQAIIVKIDSEIKTQKSLKQKTLGSNADELRYVEVHDFVTNIDKINFNTFVESLELMKLKQTIASLGVDNAGDIAESFGNREYALRLSVFGFYIAIVLSVLGFSMYGIQTYKNLQKNDVPSVSTTSLDKVLGDNVILTSLMKFGIPLSAVVLILSIMNSYIVKQRVEIGFDKERMRDNTDAIKAKVDKLTETLDSMKRDIPLDAQGNTIASIELISQTDKVQLYEMIKSLLISYDKCNYIIGNNQQQLPFPYAEVIGDGLMIAVLAGTLYIVISRFAPIERVIELKDLIEYKQTAVTMVNDPSFIKEIQAKIGCHENNVETIMFTIKAIATTAIILFFIIYSVKVSGASKVYKHGLYNSSRMQNSQCCD
jgi:hypothetical protein